MAGRRGNKEDGRRVKPRVLSCTTNLGQSNQRACFHTGWPGALGTINNVPGLSARLDLGARAPLAPHSIVMAAKPNRPQSDDGLQRTKILLLGQQGSVLFLLAYTVSRISALRPAEVVRPPSSNVFSTICLPNKPSFSILPLE